MKKITLLLSLTLVFQSYSQIERIDNADWLLHNLVINSENHFNPVDSDGNQVSSSFDEISGVNQSFFTWFCDGTEVVITYNQNNSSFSLSSMGTTLGGCEYAVGVNSSAVADIHYKFINFFSTNGVFEGIFNYEIMLENLDIPRTLTITSSNGDIAIFHHSEYLNSKEFLNIVFKIYPNPVQNELFISSEKHLKNYSFQIFDVLGKVKISGKLENSKSINIETLSKGIYIIRIKDDSENTISKKFIKI